LICFAVGAQAARNTKAAEHAKNKIIFINTSEIYPKRTE
jgi:hypothetical protein